MSETTRFTSAAASAGSTVVLRAAAATPAPREGGPRVTVGAQPAAMVRRASSGTLGARLAMISSSLLVILMFLFAFVGPYLCTTIQR